MSEAPKVFISYSHDSTEQANRILALANRLRVEGIDCALDQYEESPPGWPRWCDNQVEDSKFVLVACTDSYMRRFKGKEGPGKGLRVAWEGHIITQELYNAQGKNTSSYRLSSHRLTSVQFPSCCKAPLTTISTATAATTNSIAA